MEKTFNFAILGLMLILSIGFISANILVAGTVYDGKPSNFKAGVSVTVTCDLQILETTSLSDGAYAVIFDVDSCSNILVESDYEASQIIMEVDDEVPQNNNNNNNNGGGGGGGSSRYYYCGNGVCDSGETANTCAKDCAVENELIDISDSLENEEANSEDVSSDNKPGITGRVINGVGEFVGNYWLILAGVFLAIIVFFIIRKIRK